MTKQEMLRIVKSQLATDLNCTPDDFDRDGFMFCEAKENPGRRPFPRGERHFEMYTMGSGVIVSATPDILPFLREQLDGKTRDEAFDMPFVYGQGICHLPDIDKLVTLPMPDGVEIVTVAQPDISSLYAYEGFYYALNRGPKPHARPDMLATVAYVNGVVAGMAGASDDCEMMWQIGMDVLPDYRNNGLAAYLVNRLTLEILERGYVPYYGTSSANIASQRVAHRAGYAPAWICAYKGKFEGYECSPTS